MLNSHTSENFIEQIDAWLISGGEFPSTGYECVDTLPKAKSVVNALREGDLTWHKQDGFSPPNLHDIVSLVQSSRTVEVDAYLKQEACPLINQILLKEINNPSFIDPKGRKEKYQAKKWHESYLMALKVISYYGRKEDSHLIIKMAKSKHYNNHFMWSLIFDYIERFHPEPLEILEALRNPLPEKFCNIAYLDFSNMLAFNNTLESHPFDTDSGKDYLKKHIVRKNGYESYAISAVKALPFLSENNRRLLLIEANKHSSQEVRDEIPWALCRIKSQEGIIFLKAQVKDPRYHKRASKYASAIEVEIESENYLSNAKFKALVELSNWLGDEQYFWGQPPGKLKVVGEEKLYWPDTETLISFWSVKYRGQDYHDEPEKGIAVASEVGFYRFYDYNDKLDAFANAVSEDESYKPMVETWPNIEWCSRKLKSLNPKAFSKKWWKF